MRGVATPVLVLALFASVPAAADPRQRLVDVAELWTGEIEASLRDLTFDLVDLDFDVFTGVTRLRLGGGGEDLALRLDGDIRMVDGWARVSARFDVSLAGTRLRLQLPDIDVTSHTIYGERAVVVKVPLFEGSF